MPDKLKNGTGTGESPRIYPDDVRYRQEAMTIMHLPEGLTDAGASTGLMPIVHEPDDDEARREVDSPDTRYSG